MTLEDFFTLSEMKDGLTVPSRVEELVTVMKEEKECVKNVSDVTRQWTAVASTIAATENIDCLDLFIQLDGLLFLGRWLKDAQEFGNDSSDSFVEESNTALLRALEKLHRNREMSISSEICNMVKNLLGHNSSRVQDSARLLFDSWKQGRVTDHVDSGGVYEISDTATVTVENNGPQCSAKERPVSRGSSHEENYGADAAKSENLPSSLDGVQPESTKDSPIETANDELQPHINSDHSDMEKRSPFLVASSFVSNPVQENSPKKEELPAITVEETASHETCSLLDSKLENIEVSDAQKLNGLSSDEKLFDVTASNSSTVEHAGVGSALEVTAEPNSQSDSEANRSHVPEPVNLADEKTHGSEPKKAVGDLEAMNHSSNSSQLFKIADKDIESHLSMLRSSSEYKLMYKKPGSLETRFSRKSDIGIADDDKENCGFEDLRGGSRFTGSPVVMDTTTSDIELEYGIVDALEVARIVAQEVEREVVDDREPSSSSSEKISEGGIRQPNALGSINGNQDLPSEALPNEVSAGPTQSAPAQTEGDGPISSNDADNEPNELHDMETSQVTVAQDPEPNTERSLCDFDLNQEICSDDMERAATSITPVSVVSASRAAAVSGLPAAPLQFEGTLGWKGSAATSAFRPASPRRNCYGDKTLSLGGTNNSSKQGLDCLTFDLNVAEAVDEQGAELRFGKQVTASSGLHSAESSKANHRKSERLELDLNCISDDGDAPALDSRVEEQLFYDRNGHHSQSPVSSSSAMQSSLRNFDLNNRPYSQNNALEQGPYPGRSSRNAIAHGGPKPNDPVISIMGTRVEVNRKDFVSEVVAFPNGKAFEPTTDGSITRTAGFMGLVPTALYTHSPAFSAPKMSFSSAIYGASGSIPYIVDSGAHVPQLMGSTSAIPIAYSQAQFMVGMGYANAGLNGSGPSRPSIDLNFGLAIEGGNTESMGSRQPFMPAQGRSIEEHLRANTQASSSSGVSTKRKEPDGGWDPYTFNYRQQQFPWKQ